MKRLILIAADDLGYAYMTDLQAVGREAVAPDGGVCGEDD